jgi:hypothetical protein
MCSALRPAVAAVDNKEQSVVSDVRRLLYGVRFEIGACQWVETGQEKRAIENGRREYFIVLYG